MLLQIPPPPDLASVLTPIGSILVAIVAIASVKLLAMVAMWNYRKINGFIKKDWNVKQKGMTFDASVVKATMLRQQRNRNRLAQLEKREALLTDSANWWAIITNPFVGLWSWIRGIFR